MGPTDDPSMICPDNLKSFAFAIVADTPFRYPDFKKGQKTWLEYVSVTNGMLMSTVDQS